MKNKRERKALARETTRVRPLEGLSTATESHAATLAPFAARSSRAFDGHTPLIVNREGAANFRGQGAGGCGRSRMGRAERTRDGGLRFSRDRNANASGALTRESEDFPPVLLPRVEPEPMHGEARASLSLSLDNRQRLREASEARAVARAIVLAFASLARFAA